MKLNNRQIPLHIQIANDLLAKLRNGEPRTGGKLPPEERLAKEYEVSRATVRQAILTLARDGLLHRRQGSGTYLTKKVSKLQQDPVWGTGRNIFLGNFFPEMSVLEKKEITCPAVVARELGLSEGERVIFLRRVASVERKPLAYINNYLQWQIGSKLREKDLENRYLLDVMREDYGIQSDRLIHSISVERANGEISRLLKVMFMDPVLAFKTVVFRSDGTPLELVRSYFREDRYQYIVELKGGFDE